MQLLPGRTFLLPIITVPAGFHSPTAMPRLRNGEAQLPGVRCNTFTRRPRPLMPLARLTSSGTVNELEWWTQEAFPTTGIEATPPRFRLPTIDFSHSTPPVQRQLSLSSSAPRTQG